MVLANAGLVGDLQAGVVGTLSTGVPPTLLSGRPQKIPSDEEYLLASSASSSSSPPSPSSVSDPAALLGMAPPVVASLLTTFCDGFLHFLPFNVGHLLKGLRDEWSFTPRRLVDQPAGEIFLGKVVG